MATLTVYKNGNSATIHSVDYPGWEADGWTLFPVAGESVPDRVNLNSATLAQLKKLPGVTTAIANKIVEARPITDLALLLEEYPDLVDKVSI